MITTQPIEQLVKSRPYGLGHFEDRYSHGTKVHRDWLLEKWSRIADKEEAFERRGVYK
jgi:hypothetical protein